MGHDLCHKFIREENPKGPTIGHPADNVLIVEGISFLQHTMELPREIYHGGRRMIDIKEKHQEEK